MNRQLLSVLVVLLTGCPAWGQSRNLRNPTDAYNAPRDLNPTDIVYAKILGLELGGADYYHLVADAILHNAPADVNNAPAPPPQTPANQSGEGCNDTVTTSYLTLKILGSTTPDPDLGTPTIAADVDITGPGKSI